MRRAAATYARSFVRWSFADVFAARGFTCPRGYDCSRLKGDSGRRDRVGASGPRGLTVLPTEVTSFVARRDELRQAKRLLSTGRLLTLTGVGGVGKTRLALRVAKEVSRAFPDGVWLVQLADLRDPELVPYAVAEVLGVRDETGRDPLAVVVEQLRKRQPLLVLDNCEHLVDACVRLVGAVLLEAPDVRVLATSRHRLGAAGEQLLPVPPLQVPDPEELDRGAEGAGRFSALELFADRAAAVDPEFEVTAENRQSVARLCRQLDGLPLAIELAARLTRALAVEQLVERLDDRYRVLTKGSGTAMSRHQTLRAAVDWSYELCTPGEQRVWALLSVFAGAFNLAPAEAVCAGEGIEPGDVFDAVVGLVDKSVLLSEHHGAVVRYRWLDSLREYGLEKLAEFGTREATRRRHRDYYLQLAEYYEKEWFGPRQAEIVNHLRAEHDNLRTAFEFCLSAPDEVQAGLHLAGTLWFYWNCSGESAEARHWTRNLAVRAGTGPRGARAKAQWAGAVMVLIHSRSATALLASDRTDPPAQQQHEPLLPLAESAHGRGDLLAFAVLGRIDFACTLVLRGQPEQAAQLCAEALAVCQAHGELWMRSYLLRTLALARWVMGDHDAATAHARECLRLDHAVLGPQGLSRTLDLLAACAAGQGAPERAAVLLGASERIWPDTSRGPAEAHRKAGRRPVSEMQARESLGDHGFKRAFRRGSQLATDEAVVYALDDRRDLPEQAATRRSSPTARTSTRLTPREMQVAELVAEGLTDKKIATRLVLARRTVEGHVQNILTKRGFTSRTQIAVWFKTQ
jgi:predicted ATPase/DNA-binding CsgD family transcriptional regulator